MGSKSKKEIRDRDDLGRFGLGLKTASFSQCKKLTVITKQNEKILKHGGVDAIKERGDFGYSPAPGQKAEFD